RETPRPARRAGPGAPQSRAPGLAPPVRALITEMVITSDNTATDLMTLKVGGVEKLNAWLADAGYAHIRMVGRGYEYRRKLLALIDPRLAPLTPEETTALPYAAQDNPLFNLYKPRFSGQRASWVT